MSRENLRRVLVPPAPPMTDLEFQSQLRRHGGFLESLKSPDQRRRISQHPDIARAVAAVEAAFQTAHDALGCHDAEVYHQALIAVRKAIGAWGTVDGRYGAAVQPPAAPLGS